MTEDSGMDTSVAIDVGPPGGDGDEECGISFLRRSRTKYDLFLIENVCTFYLNICLID